MADAVFLCVFAGEAPKSFRVHDQNRRQNRTVASTCMAACEKRHCFFLKAYYVCDPTFVRSKNERHSPHETCPSTLGSCYHIRGAASPLARRNAYTLQYYIPSDVAQTSFALWTAACVAWRRPYLQENRANMRMSFVTVRDDDVSMHINDRAFHPGQPVVVYEQNTKKQCALHLFLRATAKSAWRASPCERFRRGKSVASPTAPTTGRQSTSSGGRTQLNRNRYSTIFITRSP